MRRESQIPGRFLTSQTFFTGFLVIATVTAAPGATAWAQSQATLKIEAGKPGTVIPSEFFGLMTEEINHAYDGGLYAELIQNRTFQDPRPERRAADGDDSRMPLHWFVVGSGKVTTDEDDPATAALPVSLRLDLEGAEGGVANDGYWGVPVRPNTTYDVSFFARAGGGFDGAVTASIRLDDGDRVVAKAASSPITGNWRKYSFQISTGPDAPTTAKARFALSASGTGSLWFSLVSLFPPTHENVPNGLRPDLMALMAELKPKFIRLPGGNYLEGGRFADRFAWKQMIGPVEHRPGHTAPWSYRSSDGFGLPEFLLWCKQLGAEPVLGVFAGYVLNGDHFKAGTPEMALYTQEALEEIEYVAGAADSVWGRRRAADGFPEPFPLRYVEIGNEDWFDRSGGYDGRFAQMAQAIRTKYPHLKIIASAPVKSFTPDLVDDHFYRTPRELFHMATMYDPRPQDAPAVRFQGGGWNGRQPNGVKTFVGEWATQEGQPTPTHRAALSDAAFIMGMEKNSDAVTMQCYAPLLVNVNEEDSAKGYPRGWQWGTNLIGYDALGSFGSPSYYAQVMLAQNKGDVVLPVSFETGPAATNEEPPRGGVGLGSWRSQVEYKDFSVTTPDGRSLLTADQIRDARNWRFVGGPWKVDGEAVGPVRSNAETWAFVGEPDWTDYTVALKARKLQGREGFLVIWHSDRNEDYHWWNIGGWENTQSRFETARGGGSRTAYGQGVPFVVEPDRWYDLKLVIHGRRAQGFIDGKLVHDETSEPKGAPTSAFATATYDRVDASVLVKVVNPNPTAVNAEIDVRGVNRIEPNATALVLSGRPDDVNSIAAPKKIAPRVETIANAAPRFHRLFPPYSFTILRLKTGPR